MDDYSEYKDLTAQVRRYGNILDVEPLFYEIVEHLGREVKRDETTKKLLVLTCFSVYTESPINVFLRGPPSRGKSYNVKQATKYFPRRDVKLLHGATPKSFIYGYGQLVDDEGHPIDLAELRRLKTSKDEEDQIRYREIMENKKWLMDFTDKIIVFLDNPNPRLLEMMKSTLSQDSYEREYKYVDSKRGMKTQTILMRGFPTFIFCTAQEKPLEELVSRGITHTPEGSKEKIEEAINLIGDKDAYPWLTQEKDRDLENLTYRLEKIKDLSKDHEIYIPFSKMIDRTFPKRRDSDMRYRKIFSSMIKTHALIHIKDRPIIHHFSKSMLICTKTDHDEAKEILNNVITTTRTGVSQDVLDFYDKIFLPCAKASGQRYLETEGNLDLIKCTIYKELMSHYKEVTGKRIGRTILRENFITPLSEIGWIDIETDPNKKSQKLLIPQKENGKIAEYCTSDFNRDFSLKEFREWLDMVENYCCGKGDFSIYYKDERIDRETLKNLVFRNNIFKGQTDTEKANLS